MISCREKRRELDVQLAHLEDGGYQHMEMSEGSLSTSRSEGSLRTSKGSLSTSKASVSSGYVASKVRAYLHIVGVLNL